jgi:hypothetical protein
LGFQVAVGDLKPQQFFIMRIAVERGRREIVEVGLL